MECGERHPIYSFLGRAGGWLLLVAWSIGWSAPTLLFDAKIAHAVFKQLQAETFVTAEGTVVDCRIVENRGEDMVITYQASIRYRYSAAGRELMGDRYRHWMAPGDVRHAERIAAAHPTGSKITVYYNPANPVESLLSAGLGAQDFFALLCSTPFNIVMFGSWVWAARLLGGRRGITPTDLQVRGNDSQLRVRPPRLMAVGAASLLALFLSLLAIIVVVYAAGAPPSGLAVAAAWAVVLLGAFFGYRAADPQREELVIDRLSGTLTIASASRGHPPVTIPLSRIVDIGVRESAVTNSENKDERNYSCCVCWANVDGGKAEATWIEQSDRHSAEQLVVWLREKCLAA